MTSRYNVLTLLVLVIITFSLTVTNGLDRYHYERPAVAFTFPTRSTTAASVHQESGTTRRYKLRGSVVKPKGHAHLTDNSYCTDDVDKAKAIYANYLVALKTARPKDRRLTPYTEVQVGSDYFEPSPLAVDKLKSVLLSAQALE